MINPIKNKQSTNLNNYTFIKMNLVLGVVFLVLLTSCVYDDYTPIDGTSVGDTISDPNSDNGGADSDNGGNTGGTDTYAGKITYHGHAKFILNQQCVSCHGVDDPDADLDLSTYEKAKNKITTILKIIDLEPGESSIMPPSGKMDNAFIQTLKDWQSDGLLEGDPNGGNNDNTTGIYTYVADISTIMTQECTACHSNTNPAGGLSLTNYSLTANNVDVIISRIDLQTGQTGIMPPAGRMAEIKIQKIKDWKTQGLKEQ